MNMMPRHLSIAEVSDIMHRLGWEATYQNSDGTMLSYSKQEDGISLNCRLELKAESEWMHSFTNMPGVQMLVRISTIPASFPHPKFSHYERRMFDYAKACEAVARTH